MTEQQEKAFEKFFYSDKCPHVDCRSDAEDIFEAGIKAGQEEREIVWHEFPQHKPTVTGKYLVMFGDDLIMNYWQESQSRWLEPMWRNIGISIKWAEIPAWLRPPAPQDNGSKFNCQKD